jgi:Fibronectin type III domain
MRWGRVLFVWLICWLCFWGTSQAATYFYFNAEDYPCNSDLPNPPFWSGDRVGKITCGLTPEGSKYFEWVTEDGWTNHYTEISNFQSLPLTCNFGTTYFVAFFFNFERINGLDIWHEVGSSADKGVEIIGDGIRWVFSRGHWWDEQYNQDHHYTVWGGNPSYHLNPEVELYDAYPLNQSGYGLTNQIQLEYDRWYSGVMALKLAKDTAGSFALWINGIKILEYDGIITVESNQPLCQIGRLQMGGTIAQPAYDAPAHHRKFDALMLTDDWQDIMDGGYLADPFEPADHEAPTIPANLVATVISSSEINLSWTASTDDVGVAGYRIYRCRGSGCFPIKQMGISAHPFYLDTGLFPSTFYTYKVSAYDEAGNVSRKSTAATKRTQPLPSTRFTIGDRVQTIEKTNVRSEPSKNGTILGTQPKGTSGVIVGGPWYWNLKWWWEIEYDTGPDGWSVQGKLKRILSQKDSGDLSSFSFKSECKE